MFNKKYQKKEQPRSFDLFYNKQIYNVNEVIIYPNQKAIVTEFETRIG